MDDTDTELLTLLRANAREPVSALARKLGLSRSTVQDRMTRLEKQGIVAGYTVRLSGDYQRREISAHVMVSVAPRYSDSVVRSLKTMPAVSAVYAISGVYDLIALLRAGTAQDIDRLLDAIGHIKGIEKTTSAIVLSTKFER